jgi:hypothetical protein
MLPRDHGSDHAAERTLTQLELDRTVRRLPSDNGMQFICPLIEKNVQQFHNARILHEF